MGWRRSPDARWHRVGDEMVLLHLATHEYFQLDAVGAFAWERLYEGCEIAPIAAAIAERWDIDPSTAAADLETLFAELAAAGLALRDEPPR